VEEACDLPWDDEHVIKVELAELDDDGDYERI
jgi:hypothetical protein